MKKYCVDCGKQSQGKRCKACYEIFQKSPEYSEHAKYVRSCKPRKYGPNDYICPDCGEQKKSPTSPRCMKCSASKRNIKRWQQPGYKEKMSNVHKEVFKAQPQKVAALRAGHKEFIDNPARKEEFYSTRIVASGEDHHWYRDGSCIDSAYSDDFTEKRRNEIRDRDKCCQMCGMSAIENGEALSVHHIDGNKEDTSYLNLIALCRSCHSKTTTEWDKWEFILKSYMQDKYRNQKEETNQTGLLF